MNEQVTGTKIAQRLLTRSEGATMAEIIQATGGPQYNTLKKLEGRGYRIRKVKEANATRYFATPPGELTFHATIAGNGQVTIPKEVRERLRFREGQKLRFTIKSDDHVVITPVYKRLADLAGMLPKPDRTLTIEEINEAIGQGAVERFLRSVSTRKT